MSADVPALEDWEMPLVICGGIRPLWPERWNLLRHGTWCYRVTAIPAGAAVTLTSLPGALEISWYRIGPGKLCIDGHAYARRRTARRRRKR